MCNKSDRDRTGWDFRVEFPMAAGTGELLDQRAPKACQIQVKSTAGESGTRISARLSSIERLAKDVAPAAVVIFRMRPDGTALMGYLIHLIDDELGRVLHRLRRVEAAGRTDVNHMTMSFDYHKGIRFKPTPEGLRDALAALVAEQPGAYSDRKQSQLAHLGYEGGGIEADALIWVESKDQLIKMLSGLEPLKPLQMQAYDRRFDIRVPYQGSLLDGVEEFAIQLPTVGACDIVMRNGPRRPAALFRCEAFASPPLEGGPILVIKHRVLTAWFREDGLDVQTNGTFTEEGRGLDEWVLLLRGLTYLASGTGTMELEFRELRLPPMTVPAGGLDGPYLEQLPRLLEFVERWQSVLALAGTTARADFAIGEIWEADAVQMATDILLNPAPLARIEFDILEGAEGEDPVEALYFDSIAFAGAAVSFAVKVILTREAPEHPRFASTRFELLDIRPGVTDLDAYGAELATANAVSILIDPKNLILVPQGPED
ncbi:hypothetical protein HZY97_09555 [Sphingomonas sp. R-74633]|nr:hypothetical protein [Sphingomonas sp. R-74633]